MIISVNSYVVLDNPIYCAIHLRVLHIFLSIPSDEKITSLYVRVRIPYALASFTIRSALRSASFSAKLNCVLADVWSENGVQVNIT